MRVALAYVGAAQSRAVASSTVAAEAIPAAVVASGASAAAAGARSAIDRILAGGLDFVDAQALWKEVEAAG